MKVLVAISECFHITMTSNPYQDTHTQNNIAYENKNTESRNHWLDAKGLSINFYFLHNVPSSRFLFNSCVLKKEQETKDQAKSTHRND